MGGRHPAVDVGFAGCLADPPHAGAFGVVLGVAALDRDLRNRLAAIATAASNSSTRSSVSRR
jgi:hypothetical protein